ncbi:hypothetical protein ITX31_06630 [Arthrobacter gandavensis]|uniref:hypothetical protein n=1 Tax=Arthrobacter gandavensis TaxID=169960 RepID=UPI00188F5888|nr:hypothetical protein [Arthrobacter gandavensis]MBF4993784.1 hypothetical protein [Arthrobacter gandavensis]
MKQTMAELFSAEDQYAYIMLVWASRAETPEEVAGRAWATMGVLEDSVPDDDPRYQDLAWVATPWDGLAADNPERYELPAPRTLQELTAETRQRANVRPDGRLKEGLPIGADLTRGGLSGESIGSFSGNVGSGMASLENRATIRFKPAFPTGDQEELGTVFRRIVSIWQPDWALLDTLRTSREIQGSRETYADYLIWLSEAQFGPAAQLKAATTERFGDGTLITVNNWSIDGVRALHQELLTAGIPAVDITEPLNPQTVPQFPTA